MALSFTAAVPNGPVHPTAALAGPLREVSSGGVTVLVPRTWEVRELDPRARERAGLQASASLSAWSGRRPQEGVEAFWLDATAVRVPSDYYYLAARGPALDRPLAVWRCRRTETRVLADERPTFDRRRESRGDFVATATGTCGRGESATRWASFVAAPGFGPVRRLGIPQSGLYYALVVVPKGPGAEGRLELLLSRVSFGGTTVSEFLQASAVKQRD